MLPQHSQKTFWVFKFSEVTTATTTTNKKKNKQKTFALHYSLKAKNYIPVCMFLYIFISAYLREKTFVPET